MSRDGKYTCFRCEVTKPIEDFPVNPSAKRGHDRNCKACRNLLRRGNRKVEQRNNILRKYGMRQEDYLVLYEAVGGKCQICGVRYKVLAVDHCHNSGKVRGLLCKKCNSGLGFFGDSIINIDKAKRYLIESNAFRENV